MGAEQPPYPYFRYAQPPLAGPLDQMTGTLALTPEELRKSFPLTGLQQASDEQIAAVNRGIQQDPGFMDPPAGSQPALPLTRRERLWWIGQHLRRHEWRMAWMYV